MKDHASARFGARPVQMPQRRARSRRPGRSGKGPLPKLPGRVLYRAAADRRNTTRLPHGRSAGKRTEPAEAPPPHICEGLTVFAAGSEHPNGTGTGHVPRFGSGSMQVSGSASSPAGRSLQERESTPGPTRAHSGPQTAPCANGNTPPATQSVHAFRTASPANGNGIAGPDAFYYSGRIPAADRRRRPDRITRSYTKCKPAETRPVCTGAPARVCPWRALLFV